VTVVDLARFRAAKVARFARTQAREARERGEHEAAACLERLATAAEQVPVASDPPRPRRPWSPGSSNSHQLTVK